LRAILGTLPVEQLYRDREAFAQKVQEVSADDMASMGLEIVSFVIKDIRDVEVYLETLGRPRIAQIKRDANIGEAEADVILAQGKSAAEAARATGLAEADVIPQQGLSGAEATHKNAEAWKEYTQAAVIQQIIDALPEVAGAVAYPLAKTKRIVVINSGNEGGAGASRITRDVTDIVAQVPATIEALTGSDLMSTLQSLPGLVPAANHSDEGKKVPETMAGSGLNSETTS